MTIKISQSNGLRGELIIPADKSISHRAIMLGAMARGKSCIHNLLLSEDVKTTLKAFQSLGTSISFDGENLVIEGRNFNFKRPQRVLDMENSGTTTRLLLGILAGQKFDVELVGDDSLSRRPMGRVIEPLSLMGSRFSSTGGGLPLTVQGADLRAINYSLPLASAQVKSALIFAGLQAENETHLIEKGPTRNHTERMLPLFGGKINVKGKEIFVQGSQSLEGGELVVPGDISSAAFWIVAALIVPGSEILLRNVGINETRTGILEVVRAMGGNIELSHLDKKRESADLHVTYGKNLKGTVITEEMVPQLIDELPLIALLATQAQGETVVLGAADLRHKESDRIRRVTEVLSSMAANIKEKTDGWIIKGPSALKGTKVNEPFDHRIQMMSAIAGLAIKRDQVELENTSQIATSYPGFFKDLEKLWH